MEREKIEAIIESLLFVAGEPVSFRRMCEIIAEAQKAEVQAQNTDNLSPQTQAEIADIEARRKVLEVAAVDTAPQPADTATAAAEPRP